VLDCSSGEHICRDDPFLFEREEDAVPRFVAVFGSMVLCLILVGSISGQQPPATTTQSDGGQQSAIPPDLQTLFLRLDALGRNKVKDAKFVELHLSNADEPGRRWSVKGWLVSEDERTVTVLEDDLLPWIYQKKSSTKVPHSWHPVSVTLESITEANFENLCRELVKPKPIPKDEMERLRARMNAPGPSRRLLIAHAAWKKGLSNYCVPLLANEPDYKGNFEKYQAAVLEDLAWLHFLRGVNLLMYADRREVLPQLRLAKELSPKGEYAAQAQDLLDRLQRLVAEKGNQPDATVDASKLSEAERAKLYVSQLRDLCCPQMSQPGAIEPYLAIVDGKPDQHPPTLKLKEMGMKAVPALIAALEDDTPTRTVYHWRDFAHSRIVWRVSDFAWNILRDITNKDFGDRPVVGFTFGSMEPGDKRSIIEDVKRWYASTKNLSPDDRVFASFASHESKDWITAGKYFLAKKDQRAVKPLLEKIPKARSFTKGELCELVARFGDPSAKETIESVMKTADEHSDRLSAAIALWTLGDNSGVPVVIKYVKAKEQPYGTWDTPIWFLMRVRTKEAMNTLESVVKDAPAQRAGEVVDFIMASITGDLWGKRHEPAGCVEACPALIAGMERSDYTGGSINNVKTRIKDSAAKAFVLLRDGKTGPFGGRFLQVDPKSFNELEPDEAKRDAQIRSLKEWYEQNKGRLTWDSKKQRLVVKQGP
jgi:hypothetical protein